MSTSLHRGQRVFLVESEYLLRIDDAVKRPPLALFLHGYAESADHFARRFDAIDAGGAALLFAGGPIPLEHRRADGSRAVRQVWYCYDGDQDRFRDSLEDVEAYLEDLVGEVAKKHEIDASRLAVIGWSMGAYAGGFYALRRTPRPLGLALLGGRLKHEFLADRLSGLDGFRALFSYGERDEHLAREGLEEGQRLLAAAGAEVKVHVHDGGHAVTEPVVEELGGWLRRLFA